MSCTLGEVKNRADFIIYWGGNPAECHPRHFTRYTLTQKGKFLPRGRKDRLLRARLLRLLHSCLVRQLLREFFKEFAPAIFAHFRTV